MKDTEETETKHNKEKKDTNVELAQETTTPKKNTGNNNNKNGVETATLVTPNEK